MTLDQLEYRKKVSAAALSRQRKLLESYYLLKSKAFKCLQFEAHVKEFIRNGTVVSESQQALSILFSDVDPELYDLPDELVLIHLDSIYQELFASSSSTSGRLRSNIHVPRINVSHSSAYKQNAPRTPHDFSGMYISIDNPKGDGD